MEIKTEPQAVLDYNPQVPVVVMVTMAEAVEAVHHIRVVVVVVALAQWAVTVNQDMLPVLVVPAYSLHNLPHMEPPRAIPVTRDRVGLLAGAAVEPTPIQLHQVVQAVEE